jgi:hypothetical protein
MKLQHFIITRYNLGLYATKAIRDKEAWMKDRLRLFQTYTVPSIRNQTNKDFIWIVLVDNDTPVSECEEIEDSVCDNTIILMNQWGDVGRFDEKNCEQLDWKSEFVVLCNELKIDYAAMTRLDNDDALVNDFTESMNRMLGTIRDYDNAVIDCNCGMFFDERDAKAYVVNHPYGSPFITYVQKVENNMNTVYCRCHRDVAISTMNRHYIQARSPMWVEVIHGNNKSNRIIEEMIVSNVSWLEYKGSFGL